MPFDSVVLETKPDLTVPTLEGLAWLLRHPAEWPADHFWDFGIFLMPAQDYRAYGNFLPASCGTVGCAGGLAWRQWGDGLIHGQIIDAMEELFHISPNVSDKIFSNGAAPGFGNSSITAAHVADRIDDYLAGRPIRE